MQRVLILEPYFGGSHKHFLEGLQAHVAADYTLLSLPARKWKMRMQLSAVWFVHQIKNLSPDNRHFDTVLLSTFVDAAVFRAMVCQVPGWAPDTKIVTYYHENQFAYPQQYRESDNRQFTAINVNSALASDAIAFNTSFNRDTFLHGCRMYQQKISDMDFPDLAETLLAKSRVIHPGIDFKTIDKNPWRKNQKTPIIVWNHRWEHDKNPEEFFQALHQLDERDIDFQLIVLGQSFNRCPDCFKKAQVQFKGRLVHFGFADTYQHYAELLGIGDIVISTAIHEFFGIAVIEAVRAGCVPLLPSRLSYPELFDSRFLYQEGSLSRSLETLIHNNKRLAQAEARVLTERYSWQKVAGDYEDWMFGEV